MTESIGGIKMEFGENTTNKEEKEVYEGDVEFTSRNQYGGNNGYEQTSYEVKKPLSIPVICLLCGVIMTLGDVVIDWVMLALFAMWMYNWHLAYGSMQDARYTYNVHNMKTYRLCFFCSVGVAVVIKIIFTAINVVTFMSHVIF